MLNMVKTVTIAVIMLIYSSIHLFINYIANYNEAIVANTIQIYNKVKNVLVVEHVE